MSNHSNKSEKNKLKSVFQKRPKNISDLHVSWAIRDIPKSELTLAHKGILLIFTFLIGNRSSIKISLHKLENPMGMSGRRLTDHFTYLEDTSYLIIKRPDNYVKGEVNEYGLNYEHILSTAEKFSCDKS